MGISRRSFQAADAVVAVLNQISGTELEEARAFITAYSIGRENGYVLHTFDKETSKFRHVTFSENRNSDAIVVYPGDMSEAITDGREKLWEDRRLFNYSDVTKAAGYIIELLGI